jgi:hypothetical protein
MSDFMTTFLIIMSEATGFFALVIIVLIIFRIRSGIKIKRIAKKFVKRIKNEDTDHSVKLKNILLNDYALDESEATSAVDKLIQHEHLLYSKIIELYLGSKDRTLDDIGEDVKNLTKIMHGVTINSSDNSDIQTEPNKDLNTESNNAGSSDEITMLQQELKKVKAEKEQIQLELKDALDTMEGMMTEYASMYAGGGVNERNLNPDEDIAEVKDKISEIKNKSEQRQKDEQATSEVDLNVDVPDLDVGEDN